jgi:hypothetical protein
LTEELPDLEIGDLVTAETSAPTARLLDLVQRLPARDVVHVNE